MMKALFRQIIPVMILAWISSGTDAPAASGDWTVTVTVSTPYSTAPGGVLSIPLSAGARNGAGDGYDNAADTVSLLEADDPLQAHFPHGAVVKDGTGDGIPDGWDCPSPEPGYTAYQCSLWRDFRAVSQTGVWSFEILSTVSDATVSLDWRIDGDPGDLEALDLTLVDLSSVPPLPPIPLAGNSRYTYTNVFDSGKKYGLRKFEIRMKNARRFITPPTLPRATSDVPYSADLRLTGGGGIWSLGGGNLPPGLSLDPLTGVISGVPSGEGTYPFTVVADDPAGGSPVHQDYTLRVYPPLVISTTELAGGTVYDSYSQSLNLSGGVSPLKWTLSSGILPEGLALDSSGGQVSGTLQVSGIFEFTVRVEDAIGAKAYQNYRVVVTDPEDKAPPAPIADLQVLYDSGSSVILSWSAPVDPDSLTRTAAAYDLRYLPDCPGGTDPAGWWESAVQVPGEPRPQSGALQIYTLGGLEAGKTYCAAIRSRDASDHLSGPSNGVVFPDGASGKGTPAERLVTREYSLHSGYNLISVPLILVPNDLSVLEDDVGAPAALYRWYSPYPDLAEPRWYLEEHLQPGYGYFLYSPRDGVTLDLTGVEVSDPEVLVPLHPGWNLVGNPYDIDIRLPEVLVKSDPPPGSGAPSVIKAFEPAAAAGWVGNALYPFNGLGYEFLAVNDDPPAVLKPGLGFWLYVQEGGGEYPDGTLKLTFRKPLP